jgi:hypothetical protein
LRAQKYEGKIKKEELKAADAAMALLAAQGRDHTVLPQDRLKSFLPRAGGA